MITIKDTDFEMEQTKDLPFFDLKMPVIVNEGKETERTEMKIVGHAMPFHMCIKEIVAYRLNTPEKIYIVSEYRRLFEEEVEKLSSLINFTMKTSKEKADIKDEEEEIIDDID